MKKYTSFILVILLVFTSFNFSACGTSFSSNRQNHYQANYPVASMPTIGDYSFEVPVVDAFEVPTTEKYTIEEESDDYEYQYAPSGTDYIGNKNTKKFHYDWCSSVDLMNESNKYYYTGTRDEMIDMGYIPCKKCNP